jgi:small subunit ribosomal protein S17
VLSQEQIDEERVKQRLLKDVRSAEKGRVVSRQRLEVARKQGLRIPTEEEAMAGVRRTEEERGGKEAHKGQAGQGVTAKQRRLEQGKKTKGEIKAEETVKKVRRQTSKA